MNLSCSDTNIRNDLHFWVEICIKSPFIEVSLYGNEYTVPKFPTDRGCTVVYTNVLGHWEV